jgi:hypothetical protein
VEASTALARCAARKAVIMRTLLVSGVLFAATATACARPNAPAAKAPLTPDASTLTYAVSPDGHDGAALLEGRTTLAGAPLKFQTVRNDGTSTAIELRRTAHLDGTFDVEAFYVELTGDRRTIKWNTIVRLARGGTASAKVAADGFARELRLRAE